MSKLNADVFWNAANSVAVDFEDHLRDQESNSCCCPAIAKEEIWKLISYDYFKTLFKPENSGVYWWKEDINRKSQLQRHIALLLCYEMVKNPVKTRRKR